MNCNITQGWTCRGEPSVCERIPVVNRSNLAQEGLVNVNTNNVFVTLKTNPTFTFADESERQNFIKTDFGSGRKPTVYCSQRRSPHLNLFDCLLIYPSGVPNEIFNVNFSFRKDGVSGKTTVEVNPFAVNRSNRVRRDRT